MGLISGLGGECIPELALGPKAASAEPLILTHRSMHNIHRSMDNIHLKDLQPSLTPVHVHILTILSSGLGVGLIPSQPWNLRQPQRRCWRFSQTRRAEDDGSLTLPLQAMEAQVSAGVLVIAVYVTTGRDLAIHSFVHSLSPPSAQSTRRCMQSRRCMQYDRRFAFRCCLIGRIFWSCLICRPFVFVCG